MLLSIVIPAYNSDNHIKKTIYSIYKNLSQYEKDLIEVIIVDDGLNDFDYLKNIIKKFDKNIKLISHNGQNKGMCAARNSGIINSSNEYVTLLDADDLFIDDWFSNFKSTIKKMPKKANICFTQCVTNHGEITASEKNFTGWLYPKDIIKSNHAGEYNPIFKGKYIRNNLYIDLGTKRSCGIISYFRMSLDHPIWISDNIMRIYNISNPDSISKNKFSFEKSLELKYCYEKFLDLYGNKIFNLDKKSFYIFKQKIIIYKMFAYKKRFWKEHWYNRSLDLSFIVSTILLIMGPNLINFSLNLLKKFKIIKKYG